MKLRILLGALLASGLALVPAAAHAKGPTEATMTGPGIEAPIDVGFDEQPEQSVSHLADLSGFYGATLGMAPDPNRLEAGRPAGDLGPRYDVVYRFGPDSSVRQQLYPFARPVAVTYTRPGQRVFVSERTKGGWYRAPELKPMLIALGLPAAPPARPRHPADSSSSTLPVVPVVVGGVLVLLIALLLAFTPATRTRKWPRGQPVARPVR
jgi:hypothetical protein